MNEQKTVIPPLELLPPGGQIVTTLSPEPPPVDNVHVAPGCEQFSEAKTIEVVVMPAEEAAPDHGARTHHKNSPSKLPYLAACPGYENFDSGDNDAAEQGTRLHEYMDVIVSNWTKDRSRSLLQHLEDLSRTTALDETERPLLVHCIRELTNWVLMQGAEIVQEIKVEVHRPDGSLATSGHLDLLILLRTRTSGLLIDYKFGWLRVKEARDNEQGLAYALGCFEMYPTLDTIAIQFIQPRLGVKTSHVLKRVDFVETLDRLSAIVERAEYVQQRGFTPETIPMLKTGTQCLYCAHTKRGTCPARLNVLAKTATAMMPMEFPPHWSPEQITTPEQAALARYAVERIEDFLDPIKQRVKEIALAHPEQRVGVKLANGEEVVYKIEQHKYDRSLGKALDVAKALEMVLTLEEILGCADLSITKLSEIATNAIYEQTNEAEKRELAVLDERHRLAVASNQLTKSAAEKERKNVRAKYAAQRITKKSATEQFEAILTTQGLLTRADGTVPQLRRDKSGVKQLTSQNKNNK